MADLLKTFSNPHGTLVFTESAATSTYVDNVFAKTAPVLYAVKLDNSANSTEAVYLKLYADTNAASTNNITLGTTNPFFVMKAPASGVVEMYIPGGMAFASSNYAHMAVTTTAGVAGTTTPTGTVAVTLVGG
tara:strand:+ start:63 stop:458 length:396 start_codon:yes stop_codon:yes gene_type:complete